MEEANAERSGSTVMETLSFILLAIALYFAADWILRRAEARAGRRFENRSIIFFGLLLAMALASFAVLRNLLGIH